MIVILKNETPEEKAAKLIAFLKSKQLDVHVSKGQYQTVLGLVGDTSSVDTDLLESLEIVEKVQRVSEPFKKANRRFHEDDSSFRIGNGTVGAGAFALIAGPCSMESEEEFLRVAIALKKAGATILRGGVFRDPCSPYEPKGSGEDAMKWLLEAKKQTGLPVSAEIGNETMSDAFADVDLIEVGALNMQNYALLKELGRSDKPVLLKRAPSATVQEWLLSAEHILAGGNEKVLLCENGIRTFETHTRLTADISALPVLKELTHLPVLVDPSHATGVSRYVPSVALAAAAAGADGLMIEVHEDPTRASYDGAHALTPAQFASLAEKISAVRNALR